MHPNESIALTRDVEASVVPVGTKVTLHAGETAHITQSLGGSYTVIVNGNMFRIDGKDADALGRAVQAAPTRASGEPRTLEQVEAEAWVQMKNCYDPEIPVNIVDLGLVYDLQVSPMDDGRRRVDVKMTLTAQGCGMGPSIAADAKYKLLSLPEVGDAEVEIVWSPQWNPNMISPAGREKLGME